MAKKKTETTSKATDATISFRCPVDIADGLKDLAHLSRRDVSSILVEMASELIKANASRIKKFRQSAVVPIQMPTCKPAPVEGCDDT